LRSSGRASARADVDDVAMDDRAEAIVTVSVRRANGWGDKATVPLWIAMPSHESRSPRS